ncbi:hypothetical protein [Lachnotalea sp. AF33-28]|uniref:hypothetical protein n=1 Tax=Lachnotalea sp. AF33-28 TaxID=2292046 RepID=UPI001FAB2A54|nr:hypothetical protein [Lachnotalea sp. AF33-28]
MSFIEVRDLRKEYKVEKKGSGSHFWRREYEKRHAVDGISFTIGRERPLAASARTEPVNQQPSKCCQEY